MQSSQRNSMRTNPGRGLRRVFAAFAALLALAPLTVAAQVSDYGQKQMGDPAPDHLPSVLDKVGIRQKLGTAIPLDGSFRDETGKSVRLGDYFGRRPVILALVYYQCPLLCSEELDGLAGSLEMVKLDPGKDFEVVAVSIDPSETPAMAAKKKALYLKRYGRPQTAGGWHFLTGQQPPINALADATGFGYVRVPGPDGKKTQFAHASSIEILTPDARLAQYYLGVEYSPRDLQFGLIEASNHKIGTPVENILTYCYRYDPARNTHSLAVARIVQAGCLLTIFSLGGFMFVNFRRDIRNGGNGNNGNG